MHRPSAAVGAMELEHMFGEIDAEDVDFYDEPPRVRLGRQCPPKGGAGKKSSAICEASHIHEFRPTLK